MAEKKSYWWSRGNGANSKKSETPTFNDPEARMAMAKKASESSVAPGYHQFTQAGSAPGTYFGGTTVGTSAKPLYVGGGTIYGGGTGGSPLTHMVPESDLKDLQYKYDLLRTDFETLKERSQEMVSGETAEKLTETINAMKSNMEALDYLVADLIKEMHASVQECDDALVLSGRITYARPDVIQKFADRLRKVLLPLDKPDTVV